MELPKNIVQIGRPDKVHKIFVEDYVVSYIKQLNKACDGRAVGLALYGRHYEEEGCHYYFLYGASKIQGLEQRGPYLSQADKEEIDETGKKYFDEYEFLAWCSIKGEPLESFFVLVQGKGIEISGYACFYEKNESMLNYMLLLGEDSRKTTAEKPAEAGEIQNGEQKTAVKPARGEWKAADYMRIPETPEEKKGRSEKSAASKKSEHMKIAVAAVFLVLCVVGITTLNDYGKLEDLQVAARQVIASMTEQKIPDIQSQESPSPSPDTETQNTPPPFWPPVQPSQTPSDSEGQVNQENPDMTQPSGQDNAGTGTQQGQSSTGGETQQGQDGTGSGTQQGQDSTGAGTQSGQEGAGNGTQPEGQDSAAQTGQNGTSTDSQEAQSNTVQAENQTPAERPQPTAYTVVKGDTLIDICMRQYGSLENIEEICHLNGITDANNIQVGQTILLP